ncbi:hypothetical protein CBM2609_B70148 [Cupriavidus taiwanensis]|nr:hypothetical protein CBM2609_B70148 [Cupriavidus taiwanensis]
MPATALLALDGDDIADLQLINASGFFTNHLIGIGDPI